MLIYTYISPDLYAKESHFQYIDNAEGNVVEHRESRYRRAIEPSTRSCRLNQYYDQKEGRCLGVPGGGKALHVDNERSCGVNVLKPHCTSSRYYFVCKRDKTILAQCANGQHFDNRFQRCIPHDTSESDPITIRPDEYRENRDHIQAPHPCTRSGRFPVPDHCSVFYVCETNGHRLVQSVFKCPRGTGYHAERKMCVVMSECENSAESTICAPNAPDEAVESPSADKVTEENVDRPVETPEESETANVNEPDDSQSDSTTKTTPESPSSADGYQADDIKRSFETTETVGRTPSLTENAPVTVEEAPNEEDESVSPLLHSSPTTAELDDASHSVTTSITPASSRYATDTEANSNIDSETTDAVSSVGHTSSELHETTQTSELYRNIEASEPNSVSDTSESSSNPFHETSTKLDEETKDEITEQYRNNDDSTVTPPNFNSETIDPSSMINNLSETPSVDETSTKLNEETKDETTEQYGNNDDSTVTLPYSNSETVDSSSTVNNLSEAPSIDDTSTKLDEETENRTAGQYKNDDDSAETPPNSDAEAVDPNPTVSSVEQYRNNNDVTTSLPNSNAEVVDLYATSTISDILESTSGPSGDDIIETSFKHPTSDATSSSDIASDFDPRTTTEGLTETSAIDEQ